MSVVYEIPLRGRPERLTTTIAGKQYGLRTFWVDADEGGWHMDLLDANGADLICGIALVPGPDLLGQHAWVGVGAAMYLYADDWSSYTPFTGLGTTGRLVFVVG